MLQKSYETLDNTVYNRLKEMIINKELKPLEPIVQNQLSMELGVSRTPLRKALGELEKEGLLLRSSKGWYAKEFKLQDMISIFEIRAVLEGLSCRMAAPNLTHADLVYMETLFREAYQQRDSQQADAYYKADIKFHNMIMEAAGDEILQRTALSNDILGYSFIQGLYREPKETFTEHLEIINALRNRDGLAAEQLMRSHIQKAILNLKSGKIDIYK
ncbi:GntR family transcriptional regulator [Paenibacillus piri]|nr:GntR family transcriptional regulator [Paenibacillus piri]